MIPAQILEGQQLAPNQIIGILSVPQGNLVVIQGVANLNIVTMSTVGVLYPVHCMH